MHAVRAHVQDHTVSSPAQVFISYSCNNNYLFHDFITKITTSLDSLSTLFTNQHDVTVSIIPKLRMLPVSIITYLWVCISLITDIHMVSTDQFITDQRMGTVGIHCYRSTFSYYSCDSSCGWKKPEPMRNQAWFMSSDMLSFANLFCQKHGISTTCLTIGHDTYWQHNSPLYTRNGRINIVSRTLSPKNSPNVFYLLLSSRDPHWIITLLSN